MGVAVVRFEFATSQRIAFGEGAIAELPAAVAALGTRALFVTGSSPERTDVARASVSDAGIPTHVLQTSGEPTVATVQNGLELARRLACDMVVAMGGGSALDAGKAIAGLFPNPGEIRDYLEVVGKGLPLPQPGLPFVAVPTTAGTGSEVTRNAVLSVPEQRVKVSLRHPSMIARTAIIDPQLTYDLPRAVTASSGLDALVQLIEPFVCVAPNPMVDAVCREGIRRIARSIRRACLDGSDTGARADMALGALFSGMALSNAKLGAVHGFAGPIGGRFDAPHGSVCACLLPSAMQVNLNALRERTPASEGVARFDELGSLLTGSHSVGAEAAIQWIRDLYSELNVAGLSSYGVTAADFQELIEAAKRSSSMKGNPIPLTDAELHGILAEAL